MLPGHSDSWEGVLLLLALPPSVALGPRATDHLIFQELVWNTAKLLHFVGKLIYSETSAPGLSAVYTVEYYSAILGDACRSSRMGVWVMIYLDIIAVLAVL